VKVLGIIPARKNSKSIPSKNVALLCGKPLIEYTFGAAKESAWLNRIVCSTDCPQVRELAERHSIEAIERPEHLAQDETPMIPVLQHALSVAGESYDAVMLLQPTCPMRRKDEIDGAVMLMKATEASSVISYVDVGANHPARMAILINQRVPYPAWGRGLRWANKQDLPQVYIRSGDIYLTRTEVLLGGDLVGENPRAYLIPAERHLNIDTPRDLELAEFLLSREQHSVTWKEVAA
jgi:CMP-N,N'-diacetyllegionaminic acid synthase